MRTGSVARRWFHSNRERLQTYSRSGFDPRRSGVARRQSPFTKRKIRSRSLQPRHGHGCAALARVDRRDRWQAFTAIEICRKKTGEEEGSKKGKEKEALVDGQQLSLPD